MLAYFMRGYAQKSINNCISGGSNIMGEGHYLVLNNGKNSRLIKLMELYYEDLFHARMHLKMNK